MKERCAKCRDEIVGVFTRIEGGRYFLFCKFCDQFLADHPNVSVSSYLGPRFDSWVSRKIQKAHKLRMQGTSLWNSHQPERSKREDRYIGGYFPPPWSINEHPEKTEGWIAFQEEQRKDPKYYGCGALNSRETD